LFLALTLVACGSGDGGTGGGGGSSEGAGGSGTGGSNAGGGSGGEGGTTQPVFADVESVGFSGGNLDYQIAIEISSPDTGCEQYADWWEVVTAEGDLVYRQVFDGPHLDEQPFTVIQPGVPLESNVPYLFRAHMHPHGYGGAYRFQTQTGGPEPEPMDFTAAFADLAEQSPQPPPCTE
jgi:hypothetical protein